MILVPTTIHGRVLIECDEGAAVSLPRGSRHAAKAGSRLLVGFHGYGQSAADMMEDLRQIPGANAWTRVSIQALNRFYSRGDAKVVASWMTREDRDQSIADNIAYVDSAIEHASTAARQHESTGAHEHVSTPALVVVGFSQGVAMAYRTALQGSRPVDGIIALAGDIPPELKTDSALRHPWPKVLIGVGHLEQWYSSEKVAEDEAFLASRGVDHSVVRFKGGHDWTAEFRAAAGAFLAAL